LNAQRTDKLKETSFHLRDFEIFYLIQGGFKHANEETQSCGSRRNFGINTTGRGLQKEGCSTATATATATAAADTDRNVNR
jgi:hypothetical protein